METKGQTKAQIPHSTQRSVKMAALSFTRPMIPSGQSLTHIPQPVHLKTSTCGTIRFSFLFYVFDDSKDTKDSDGKNQLSIINEQ
jgi:hypothetical protein